MAEPNIVDKFKAKILADRWGYGKRGESRIAEVLARNRENALKPEVHHFRKVTKMISGAKMDEEGAE